MSPSLLSHVIKKIKDRYKIVHAEELAVGWGNQEWHFYEPREEMDENEEQYEKGINSLDDLEIVKKIKKFEKDGQIDFKDEDEDEDERAEPTAERTPSMPKNPPAVEEAHQKAVLKSRKLMDKRNALEKVQDIAFLKKIILSKAHEDLKRYAASRIETEKDAEDLFLGRTDEISSFPAEKLSKLLNDEDFITKNFDKIKTAEALRKVKDEKNLAALLLKFPEVVAWDWRTHKEAEQLLQNVDDQKLITKIAQSLENESLKTLAPSIALKSKDPKVLKKFLDSDISDEATAIALYKLRDTEEAKKSAKKLLKSWHYSRYNRDESGFIALSLIDDQKILLEHLDDAPGIVLPRITDKNKIKEEAANKPKLWAFIDDDDWKKQQLTNLKNEAGKYLADEALDFIKDESYVKEEAMKGASLSKEMLGKLEEDQAFVKSYYEKTKNPNALSFIKDLPYLEALLKKEKKSSLREQIIKNINDPDILSKLLKKERGKNTRHILIWKLRNHPEKIADYLLTEFHDSDTHEYGAKKLDKAQALRLLEERLKDKAINVSASILIEKIKDDQALLKKLYEKAIKAKDEDLVDKILEELEDEDIIFKTLKPEDVSYSTLENIKNPANIFKIALLNKEVGKSAFEKLSNLKAPEYAELALNAVSPSVRKAAIPYVEDKEVLKKVLLLDKENGADALPAFKDDQKTLEQAFLNAKDEKVISNLATRIKNQDILKEYVLKAKDWKERGLAEKIIPKIKDETFIKKLFLEGKEESLVKKALEELVKDPENHKAIVDKFLSLDDSSALSAFSFFEKIKHLLKDESSVEGILKSPFLFNKVWPSLEEDLGISSSMAAKALNEINPDSILDYEAQGVKSLLIENADARSVSSSLKKFAEVASKQGQKGFELMIACMRKLAEDPANASFLTKLYLEIDYESYRYRSETIFSDVSSIVGPFLSASQRLDMMKNPSIVNKLKLEDFKPSKDEVKEALLKPEGLNQNALMSLLKISPESAKDIFSKVGADRQGDILPFIKADFVTEENVTDVAQAIKNSNHQNAIPQALIDKAYSIGDEAVKEALKGNASAGILIERHKIEQENSRFRYRVPQHSRNIPAPLPEAKVQHNAKEELLRLLVTLAR